MIKNQTKQQWNNDQIQFPRIIEEADAAGAFSNEVVSTMAESMDISPKQVRELIDRASCKWEDIKLSIYPSK